MAKDSVLDEAYQRANLAFSNEMEMLTFYLTDDQLYGINVFKIIEIMECPKVVTKTPYSHPVVKGNIDFRGHPISLFDLAEGLGLPTIDYRNTLSYILVCEYSGTIQGFLVSRPNMLINKSWSDIVKPDGALYDRSYLTAITYHNNVPIQILDVEKLLVDILGIDTSVSDELVQQGRLLSVDQHKVLVVDDSKAACSMLSAALDQLGVSHVVMNSAQEALDLLARELKANDGQSPFTLIFTDLEMPGMDGFTFTRKVREMPALDNVRLAVHSSLSNKSNWEKAQQMGADEFVPKFSPDRFAEVLLKQIADSAKPRTVVTAKAS
ncbi:chemotaxis protein CheV [Candidatus Magnetaquicoccus inordinatus]|uniref:chemotaxis protein CheV n=1 Tax=Candidatus Magnetaquicoccus inordinatus TaxID=2496818 RepID=UPI00102C8C51|nr:chemotaxis protein [Candidatus Magnetaquicoccus inordinatus]